MKTALGVVVGVLGVLGLGVAIFYIGWLRPPTAMSVCENVVRVSRVELESKGGVPKEEMLDALYRECAAAASTPPEFGRGPWVKRLECMRDAQDYAGLTRCEDIRSI